jgi:hypothetical protein
LRYLLIATGTLLALAVFYVLDVWLLGTLAVRIAGQLALARSYPLFLLSNHHPKTTANPAAWYWHHPIQAAIAWATKSAVSLSDPQARMLWIILNLFLVLLIAVLYSLYDMDNWKRDARDNRDVTRLHFKKVDYDVLRLMKTTPPDRIVLGVDDKHRPVTVPVSKGALPLTGNTVRRDRRGTRTNLSTASSMTTIRKSSPRARPSTRPLFA